MEKKEGYYQDEGIRIRVVDLPGTYSLAAYSMEEIIARDFIIEEQPDVVISVVDASNLERNLYLTVQVLELGVPLILALNMVDMADSKGICVDDEDLSKGLRSPVVRTVAREGKGIDQLKKMILTTVQRRNL